MFCSKCGKTLKPGVEVCSCGQIVGVGRFEGVPYTSAQPRIAPEADAAQDALPYTRTTYTGKDEQLQAKTHFREYTIIFIVFGSIYINMS